MEKEDAIAIIGIACRFPGADDIDEFWEVLKNGEDHVHIIPKERWDTEAINIPDLNDDWKPSARKSGLIKDSDKWDNKFFGISDSEAGWMDPQQCLALEVTYTALEDGGFTKEKLKGTNTGVYIGVMNRDLSFGLNDASPEFNNFVATGIATSVIANRISYHFDIRGPSMTVDTACSSALVSIHLGSQAIKSGDCNMAICGGVNSLLTPINYIVLNKARMISTTGKSHTFSADADGYVRGEGCGMVILKSLKKAMEDGDKIWGIVMSGCNQDGKASTPITAPSGEQQKVLLQKIYSSYGISPSTIQYIETHGVFLKETTYGWDHKATVLVTEAANHQQVLQWTTGKKTTQIDIKSIVNTKYTSLNGMNVVTFETESRQYTFKTTVQEELETLVKLIEQQKDKSV